jgi:hypothetical protein
MELEQRIKREIEENPVLEEGTGEDDSDISEQNIAQDTKDDYDDARRDSDRDSDDNADSTADEDSVTNDDDDMMDSYIEDSYDEKVDEYSPDDYYDDELFENKRKRRRMNEEYILHDFGKHPAYRKKVMSLPPNTEIDRWGRDWNDKSAKTDEPFGKRIGKSDPYTEKVIDMLTDAVLNELSLHRKKKV